MSYWERIPGGERPDPPQPQEKVMDIEKAPPRQGADWTFEQSETDEAVIKALDEAFIPEAEFDADGYWENHKPEKEPVAAETLSAARPARGRKTPARKMPRAIIAAAIVVGVLAGGAVLIAEPWVAAQPDDYRPPTPIRFQQAVTLAVGEQYEVEIECGDNEEVVKIQSSDTDIISIDGNLAVALGQWDGSVLTITTREIEVPQTQGKQLKILGLDLSKPYNTLRSGLRSLLGIEKPGEPRTELRDLNIYELMVNVQGYAVEASSTPINLYTDDKYNLAVPQLLDNETVRFEASDPVVTVTEELDEVAGTRSFTAASGSAAGQTVVTATVGFYKGDVFVPTRAVTYNIEVVQRPQRDADGNLEDAVFASGSHNGLVPVSEPQQEPEE